MHILAEPPRGIMQVEPVGQHIFSPSHLSCSMSLLHLMARTGFFDLFMHIFSSSPSWDMHLAHFGQQVSSSSQCWGISSTPSPSFD